MKKMFKNSLFTFILGAILFSGVTAYAAKIIYATEVSYTSDKTTKTNVSDAITELYELTSVGDAKAEEILVGKKALVNGKEITGTMPDVTTIKRSTIKYLSNTYTQPYTITESGIYNIVAVNSYSITPIIKVNNVNIDIINFYSTHDNGEGYAMFASALIYLKKGDVVSYPNRQSGMYFGLQYYKA